MKNRKGMLARLKAMRKKYHLGEFRRNHMPVKKKGMKIMARRKRASRRMRYFSRRKVSRSRAGMGIPSFAAYGMYGVGRGRLASMVRNTVGSRLGGLGNMSDEVLMLGTAFAVKKFVRDATVQKIANAAMNVEAFNLGQQIGQGGLGSLLGNGATVTTQSGKLF